MKYREKIGSGDAERFDEKNSGHSRAIWDPTMQELGQKWHGKRVLGDRPGYTLKDWTFSQAAWYLERRYGRGSSGGNFALTQWEMDPAEVAEIHRIAPGQKLTVADPVEMSRDVKKAAQFFGAELVGVCEVDQRWIYSGRFDRTTAGFSPITLPAEYRYAVVMAHDMGYEVIKTSPANISAAGAGHGYSEMVYVAGLLAHFIRGLGYEAIPCGNDTALSIPLAIDAGLGELGRHGMLITEKLGPRLRLSKVFTDLPLAPDKPIEFGVTSFCDSCRRCAENCPGRAISFGEPTREALNVSNNGGILKWYVDAEKCYQFWVQNGGACANCVRVCPFNKTPGWLHDTARFLVKNTPWLDPLLVRLDKLLGYGERTKAEDFWSG